MSGINHQTLTTLATFILANGNWPNGGLIIDNSGNLYGTTRFGGAANDGTVFELTPETSITSSNASPAYGQPITFTATVSPNVGAGP